MSKSNRSQYLKDVAAERRRDLRRLREANTLQTPTPKPARPAQKPEVNNE